jgi:hypothetical protein
VNGNTVCFLELEDSMLLRLQLFYGFNATPIKFPVKIDKLILRCIQKNKGPGNNQDNSEKEEQIWESYTTQFQNTINLQ